MGKFDQFQSDLPYVGILQAIADLLRHELAEPEAQLASRRAALRNALGLHGRLLTDALPELAAIVGPQPEVESAPPRDAERRLRLLVARFLAVFAVAERPLVMFLDDLQWADPPSMQLLDALAADPSLAHLVLIAGYRTNEVGPGHPLRARSSAALGGRRDGRHRAGPVAAGRRGAAARRHPARGARRRAIAGRPHPRGGGGQPVRRR